MKKALGADGLSAARGSIETTHVVHHTDGTLRVFFIVGEFARVCWREKRRNLTRENEFSESGQVPGRFGVDAVWCEVFWVDIVVIVVIVVVTW